MCVYKVKRLFLLQGIFPACYIHLKEATVEGSGFVQQFLPLSLHHFISSALTMWLSPFRPFIPSWFLHIFF